MNVAIVGGSRFDREKLKSFILALAKKHPDAVVYTGDGKGAEKEVANLAQALGMNVVRPEVHPEWYGDEASLIQINDILIQSKTTAPLILVGTGARVTRAREIATRGNPYLKKPRLIHEIARVPTAEKPPAPRRAKKPVHD